MRLNAMMDNFMDMAGIKKTTITAEECLSTLKLTTDEVIEFKDEFLNKDDEPRGDELIPESELDRANIAKELTDILYVTAQRMRRMGMNVDALLEEVHTSNMSKSFRYIQKDAELKAALTRYPLAYIQHVHDDWYVLRDRETGKVIKPTCYRPARVTEEMYAAAK